MKILPGFLRFPKNTPEDSATPKSEISDERMIYRIIRLFRPYRLRVIMVGVLILFTGRHRRAQSLLIKVIFDSALFPSSGGPDLNLLWIIVGVMSAIAVTGGALGILQSYLTNKLGQGVMRTCGTPSMGTFKGCLWDSSRVRALARSSLEYPTT